MTENKTDSQLPAGEFAAATVSRKKGFSVVWLIPIVAVLVALWLVYKSISETGPTITIQFDTGEGLVAGKTMVRFKDVDIGKVSAVHLRPDRKDDSSSYHVIATAQMDPDTKKYLTDKSRFWVVRAHLSAGEVSGLGTLFSGAYIAMDPSSKGKKTREFVALKRQPAIDPDIPGSHYQLSVNRLSGLQPGSPVYYRQIEVGRVSDYTLQDDGRIMISIFVEAPHDKLVTEETVFWDAGGIDLKVTAEGVSLNTESLVSVLLGGVAFDLPPRFTDTTPAAQDTVFPLHPNRAEAFSVKYVDTQRFVMYFDQSLRGLLPGAPLEFRGLTIGHVIDIGMEADFDNQDIVMPVVVAIQRDRFKVVGQEQHQEQLQEQSMLPKLIEKGLRAQLVLGNLALGKKAINLDFFPDAAPATIDTSGRYPIFPTVKSPAAEILANLADISASLSEVPFDQIGQDLGDTMRGVDRIVNSEQMQQTLADLGVTMKQTSELMANANSEIVPRLAKSLADAEATLASVRNMMAANSVTRTETNRLLIEMASAAQAIAAIAEYLEQHPEALIFGKKEQK
jgi:paraquat-inducible protein B